MKSFIRISLCSVAIVGFPISSSAQNVNESDGSFTRADYLKFFTEEEGVVYTDWVDNSKSHKYWKEMTEIGMIPVRNEGRLRDGKSEYRKGFRNPKRAGAKTPLVSWYCYTGLNKEAFDSKLDELFLKGFFLISVQSFEDAKGDLRYQALWVNPNGKLKGGAARSPQLSEEQKMKMLEELRKLRHEPLKPEKLENIDVPPGDPKSPAIPSDDPVKG